MKKIYLYPSFNFQRIQTNLTILVCFYFWIYCQSAYTQTYTLGTAPATNNATITTCGGTFYDPGGAAGNYANNQNLTVTFTSTNGLPIMMDFVTYTFAAGDNLSIYNGPSTASPQFPTSPLSSGDPFLYVGTSGSITVQFISNASVVAAGWQALLYCTTESTITACSGNFYDPGGVGANYSDQQGTITHICSNNGGQARVAFSSFATEASFDNLYIYDGPTISSPQIAGSPFSGATSPGTVTGTGTCLTFFFVADQITNAAGWASTISCVPACAVSAVTATPACSGSLYNVTGNVTFSSPPITGTMTVSDGAASQVFNAPFTSPIAYSLTGLTPGTGTHTVTATFSATPSCTGSIMYAAPASCSGGPVADYILNAASNGTTVNTCMGKFADSGNLSANYGDSENYSMTFCSGTTDQITFTFNNFSTQSGSDLLYIYDGPNTSSPQVAGSPFSGVGSAASPGIVSATGACLTFRFQSSASMTNFGWEADISCSGGIAALPPAPTWNGYPGTACSPNTKIEGTVFEDFDDDGVKDALEPFIKDVSVSLFDNTGQVGAAVLTNVNGLYSFSGLTAATVYRVEFTIPTVFEEGAYGTGSGTSVQFVRSGTCSANLGLLDKGHYCGLTNPKWTIPVYANGSPTHASNVGSIGVARFNYNSSGQSPHGDQENWVTFGTIGTTWGTAYRRDDATLYMASVLRRHTGLGPGGVGAIYKRADAGTNTSSTVFYDFGASAGVVANNATRFPGAGNSFGAVGACGLCDNLDPTTFGQIGKNGLGDIDLSSDEKTMYVTNLLDRKVYTIDMNNPAPGSALALPNQPWLTGSPCTNGTARPWALKVRQGKLYVGVICDGGSSTCAKTAACNDLTATVYAYDGAAWTTVVTYPLNYYRKAYAVGSNYWVRWMDNWSDFTANYANVTDAQFAQPVMVDIEFDDDGSMIMGFGDRTAMQTGYQAPPPPGPTSSTAEKTFAHGDILRAYYNPATGTFSIENNGISGPKTTTNPASNVGPGGRAFYWGDHWYGAPNDANIGSLGILPGSGEVMHPVADPIDPYASGVVWSSNTNGKANRKLEVYQGSPMGNAPNFAKNGGLGDIELFCVNPPIEIGNYVWWDHNLNGRMDPSEPGITGVNMKLFLDPDGNTQGNNPSNGDEVLVATTTTDAFGRYIFSFSGATNGLNAQAWQPGHTKVMPNKKYQVKISNFAMDAGLTAYATSIGSATFIMSPTQNQVGAGQRDNNGYNNPGSAAAAVLTGAAGENDHGFDFAFGPGGACSVTAIPTGNTPCIGETLNLNANVSGGTAPFTYSWAGPNSFSSTAASPSIANVTAAADGTYTVTITDAASCVAIFSVMVQVNSVSVTATTTTTACGASTGSINLTVTGGITPYSFDWANNALDGTEDPTGLTAGAYPVTVTEANGCTATISPSIGNVGGPTVTAVPTNPACGNSNGSIALTMVGVGPFTFDWNVNALDGTEDPTGLASGTYMVTVTAGSCVTSTTVVLTNSTGPSIASPIFVNTTCGLNNGSIDITVSGGTPSYTYDWNVNTLDGIEDPTALAPGTYTVTVSDANSCQVVTTATIAPSTGYTASTTQVNETCSGSNGSIDLTTVGGTAPFTYDWNNVPGASNAQDMTGLAAGTYTVTITDANNCTATASATITNTAGPTTLTTTPTNATSCIGTNGAIDLQVLGGATPYTYDWNNDGHPPPDFDTEDLTGLTPGTYMVTVTDANGCTAVTAAVVGVNTGATIAIAVTDPANCNQTGALNLTITGGVTPYTVDWNNVPGTANPEDQTGLAGGSYRVTVTEANGCTTEGSASVLNLRAPAMTVDVLQPACGATDGAIDLEVVGGDGVGPYNYNWSNLAPTSDPQDQMGIGAGNYTVTVTDELFCSTTLTVSLSNSLAPELVIIVTAGTCSMSNGAIDLTVSGGTSPYDIDWDNIVGTGNPEDQTALAAGNYAVTATDAAGCTAVGSAMLEVVAAPATVCTGVDETDPGNNGEINVDATEVGPFVYDWSDNSLDGQQNPTGLTAGTYTVTVTDAFGCETDCEVVIAFRPSSTVAISDPCTCHDVVYDVNGDPLELLDYIDVTAPSGSTWQIIAHTGLETVDPLTNVPLPIPSTLTYIPALGVYRIHVAHTNGVGYSATVSDGTFTLSISNLCTKSTPQAPALASAYCGNAAAVSLPAAQSGFTTVYRVGNPAGTIITELNPALYPAPSTVDIYARFTPVNSSDCPMTLLIPVNILPVPVLTTQPGSICSGQSLDLASLVTGNTPVGALTFYATQADATAGTPTLVNSAVTPLVNTTYYVRSTTSNGCTATASLTVSVSTNPVPTVTNGTVCAGGTIDLNTLVINAGGGVLTFYSSYANAVAGTPTILANVSPASATNYYVRSENGDGCYSIKEITVTIQAPACGVITISGSN